MSKFRIELTYTSGSREQISPIHEELDAAFRAALVLETQIKQADRRPDARMPHSIEVLDDEGQMVISIMAYRAMV